MTPLARTPIELSAREKTQLRAAVKRDAAHFLARLDRFLVIDELAQPWFHQHRVLDVQASASPARRIHVAAGQRGMRVLSGHLAYLQDIAAHDPPADLDREEHAVRYATCGNAWTLARPEGETIVTAFDDIPFPVERTDREQRMIDDLRVRMSSRIRPPSWSRIHDGWWHHYWLLDATQLIERDLIVPRDGRLRRRDAVHAGQVPVPGDHHRQLPDGRVAR
jgi:hypothetical protein